jgi:hypothetical protein
MRLTPHVVSAARPKEKRYVLTDGHGLGLQVTPEGSKRWRFRYRFDRLENTISLGVYPKVGLAKARCLHADARGLLARGVDPSAERRRRRAENAHTFESVAQSWLQVLQVKARKGSITAKTVERNRRLLQRHVFPRLGSRPIAAISPSELLVILKQIESNGFLDTARRVKQRCSRVFRHAIGLGCIQCDITEGFRGLLAPDTSASPLDPRPSAAGGVTVRRGGIQGATDHGHCPKTGPIAFRQTRRAPARPLARH